jgi:hypothetical protein
MRGALVEVSVRLVRLRERRRRVVGAVVAVGEAGGRVGVAVVAVGGSGGRVGVALVAVDDARCRVGISLRQVNGQACTIRGLVPQDSRNCVRLPNHARGIEGGGKTLRVEGKSHAVLGRGARYAPAPRAWLFDLRAAVRPHRQARVLSRA